MTEKEKAIASKIDDQFLTTLVECARVIGWGVGDYIPVADFVKEVFLLAGKQPPTSESIQPYV